MGKKNKNQKKTLSRLMAIQIFFQNDFFVGQKDLDQIKEDVINNYIIDEKDDIKSYSKEIDEELLDKLLFSNVKKSDLDNDIEPFLKGDWKIENLDNIMLQILRLGTFELKFLKDIPSNVIIDEYVDIAASFFDSKKVTFANAVLDNLAKKLRG